MAQAVKVNSGDTVTHLLKRHRGLKELEISLWLPKVRRINPHISNLNMIHPREKVLLPDQLDEIVPDSAIWQNAFEHIPPHLNQKAQGGQLMYFCIGGETIDDMARNMFADTPYFHILHSSKRAVLIHNNPFLRNHLPNNRIPHGTLVDIAPRRFSNLDHHFWNSQRSYISVAWNELHESSKQVVYNSGPEGTRSLVEVLQGLQDVGAAVGMDDTVRFTGYGVAGLSGYAASGQMALANSQTLAHELYGEAVTKFGKQVVHSKKAANLLRMQRFLTSRPQYQQLMQSLKELPEHLLPRGRRVPNPLSASPNAAARHFRKAFSLPYDKWNSSRYLSTIGRRLNGKVQLLKGVGRHATWYIPAALGLYSAFQAPPELRIQALFEEGFGVVGGYAGTLFGANVVGVGLVALLGLGPLGAFIMVFICAAGFGILGNDLFKKGAGAVYEYGDQLGNGQFFYSPEQVVGAIIK